MPTVTIILGQTKSKSGQSKAYSGRKALDGSIHSAVHTDVRIVTAFSGRSLYVSILSSKGLREEEYIRTGVG